MTFIHEDERLAIQSLTSTIRNVDRYLNCKSNLDFIYNIWFKILNKYNE